jgi:hypothetical protein
MIPLNHLQEISLVIPGSYSILEQFMMDSIIRPFQLLTEQKKIEIGQYFIRGQSSNNHICEFFVNVSFKTKIQVIVTYFDGNDQKNPMDNLVGYINVLHNKETFKYDVYKL